MTTRRQDVAEARELSPAERRDIRLDLPCDPGWASLLRLTVAGLAVYFDLSIEAIDDLKLVVTEAYGHALAASPGASRVEFTFDMSADSAAIEVSTNAPRVSASRDELDVSLFVLRALVDEVTLAAPEHYRLSLRKALG